MRILYLGNNWLGYQVLKWLKGQGENIVGLVVQPKQNSKYGDEIVKCSGLGKGAIFDGSLLHDDVVLAEIRRLNPQIGLSVLFHYVLKPEVLAMFPKGVINLHPAFLPYNKGQYPNVWSIIEGTPSGVTLHYVDKGIDTGDIITQKEVPVEPADTGETLYHKLEQASIALFKESWASIKAGKAPRIRQSQEVGTYHRTRDVNAIDEIALEKDYNAKELIDILRALTFPPYEGAYFMANGKRVLIRIRLEYSEVKSAINHQDEEN